MQCPAPASTNTAAISQWPADLPLCPGIDRLTCAIAYRSRLAIGSDEQERPIPYLSRPLLQPERIALAAFMQQAESEGVLCGQVGPHADVPR